MPETFTSFAQLAQHMRAQDVKRAANLRRSAPLRVNRPAGIGPAVAR